MICSSWPRWAAAWAASLCFVGISLGADIPYPKQPVNTTPIEKMRSGLVGVDAKNKEVLAELAKWLADRIVHPPYNGEELKKRLPGPPEDLETLFADAERYFSLPNPRLPPKPEQIEYGAELGKEMAAELMYVMNESVKPLDKINAARMLALAGKLPAPELGDAYLKIMSEDKYPEQIKLFAFQGLRNWLMIPDPRDPKEHFVRANKNRNLIALIFAELDKFITKSYPTPISPERVAVIQFIRREAIRAMSQMKHSTIFGLQKQVEGRPIWTLMRVVMDDPTIIPGYTFHPMERIEALIGICSMQPAKNVNIDAVAYVVNELLFEMIDWQAREKAEIERDSRNKPLIPWKIVGYRLNEAMKLWKAHMEKVSAERNPKFALDLAELAGTRLLNKWEVDGVRAVPDARSFSSWKSDKKPKKPQILEDDPATAYSLSGQR